MLDGNTFDVERGNAAASFDDGAKEDGDVCYLTILEDGGCLWV